MFVLLVISAHMGALTRDQQAFTSSTAWWSQAMPALPAHTAWRATPSLVAASQERGTPTPVLLRALRVQPAWCALGMTPQASAVPTASTARPGLHSPSLAQPALTAQLPVDLSLHLNVQLAHLPSTVSTGLPLEIVLPALCVGRERPLPPPHKACFRMPTRVRRGTSAQRGLRWSSHAQTAPSALQSVPLLSPRVALAPLASHALTAIPRPSCARLVSFALGLGWKHRAPVAHGTPWAAARTSLRAGHALQAPFVTLSALRMCQRSSAPREAFAPSRPTLLWIALLAHIAPMLEQAAPRTACSVLQASFAKPASSRQPLAAPARLAQLGARTKLSVRQAFSVHLPLPQTSRSLCLVQPASSALRAQLPRRCVRRAPAAPCKARTPWFVPREHSAPQTQATSPELIATLLASPVPPAPTPRPWMAQSA